MKNEPEICLDDDGYPTEEYLDFIRNYTDEDRPILDMVDIICANWYFGDWGYKLRRKYKGVRMLELHTGGWSGNEEVISVIISNVWLTHFKMRYVKWEAGGHHYFEIR